jgi:hypothetical protein
VRGQGTPVVAFLASINCSPRSTGQALGGRPQPCGTCLGQRPGQPGRAPANGKYGPLGDFLAGCAGDRVRMSVNQAAGEVGFGHGSASHADDALHRQISRRPDRLDLTDMPPKIWINTTLQECADPQRPGPH